MFSKPRSVDESLAKSWKHSTNLPMLHPAALLERSFWMGGQPNSCRFIHPGDMLSAGDTEISTSGYSMLVPLSVVEIGAKSDTFIRQHQGYRCLDTCLVRLMSQFFNELFVCSSTSLCQFSRWLSPYSFPKVQWAFYAAMATIFSTESLEGFFKKI